MITHISPLALNFGDDARATVETSEITTTVEIHCDAYRFGPALALRFFHGTTQSEAQRIADAINAAIEGAKSRAAADAEAVKIAAE